MPDINYAFWPRQGWCETKVVHGDKLFFEKFQLPWMKKRLRHTGGKDLWVLAHDKDGIKLYEACKIVEAPRERIRKWSVVRTKDVQPLVVVRTPGDWLLVYQAFLYQFTPQDFQPTTQSQSGE